MHRFFENKQEKCGRVFAHKTTKNERYPTSNHRNLICSSCSFFFIKFIFCVLFIKHFRIVNHRFFSLSLSLPHSCTISFLHRSHFVVISFGRFQFCAEITETRSTRNNASKKMSTQEIGSIMFHLSSQCVRLSTCSQK